MKDKKITYSLNYRKPKSEYKLSDELTICLRYYHKCDETNKTKIIKKSTGIKCKLQDWDTDWHKSSSRNPIKDSDSNYKKKNRLILNKIKEFDFKDLAKKSSTNK